MGKHRQEPALQTIRTFRRGNAPATAATSVPFVFLQRPYVAGTLMIERRCPKPRRQVAHGVKLSEPSQPSAQEARTAGVCSYHRLVVSPILPLDQSYSTSHHRER